ncbi:MAG: hypothetical protein R3E01_32945 [Pirellulaceae bacterium]
MAQEQQPTPHVEPLGQSAELTQEERDQLANAKLQAEYRAKFLEQLRARQCPGCGDTNIF